MFWSLGYDNTRKCYKYNKIGYLARVRMENEEQKDSRECK